MGVVDMKEIEVRLLAPIIVEAETSEYAVEAIMSELFDYYLTEHYFSATEIDGDE